MDDLLESVLDYIESDYTDYAIMINGDWGCGKTYFWNNKIKRKIENLKKDSKNYKVIYMSLYGISNLEEISKKIFIETTRLSNRELKRYMKNKNQESIPEYVKKGIDMANLFGIIPSAEKLNYENLFSTEDKVLCFDDLERVNMDVIDVLGYINNFVEHDHIKTVIICNEKELLNKIKNQNLEMKTFIASYLLDKEGGLVKVDKPISEKIKDKIEYVFDNSNEYEKIKEKLIGETFEYIPQFQNIIDGLILRYSKNEKLFKFLKKNFHLIINTFNKAKTKNLRILKHSLNDFRKIFEEIEKFYPELEEKILEVMLIFTIAISFEIKSGTNKKSRLEKLKNNEEYKMLLVSSTVFEDDKDFYIKDFDNNYFLNYKSEYKFFKFIEKYVRTRIFDIKIFKSEIENVSDVSKNKEISLYKKLLLEEYWKYSDDEFKEIVEDVLSKLEEGKIPLNEIIKIFMQFYYFSKVGLIEYDIKFLKEKFLLGMEMSLKISKYIQNANIEISKIEGDFKEETKDVLEKFNFLNEKLKVEENKKKAKELFKLIPGNMELFYFKFENEYFDKPILKYFEPDKLFKRMTCTNAENIVIIKEILYTRIKKNKDFLEEEIPFLKKLKRIIDNYTEQNEKNIKNIVLNEFSKQIEKMINIYRISIFDVFSEKDIN